MSSMQDALTALAERRLADAAEHLTQCLALPDLPFARQVLSLQLGALLDFDSGQLERGRERLSRSAELQQAQGQKQGGLHSSHQMSLLTHSPELRKAFSYYQGAIANLRNEKNDKGLGLCMRSVGELCLIIAKREQAVRCFEESATHLDKAQLAEAGLVWAWLALLTSEG